jgi:hypothetical protein
MRASVVLARSLALTLLLGGCGTLNKPEGESVCLNGGSLCAAADAPPGMRKVLKGHRMTETKWIEKTNKESGVPDIGVTAAWEPITEKQ